MKTPLSQKLKDGSECTVVSGTHAGKSGTLTDIHTSKTGHVTITVIQKNGVRFKTLGKNVVVEKASKTTAVKASIKNEILAYNSSLSKTDKEICDLLYKEIDTLLPKAESKIWHAHPVWFLDGNPIVGYSKLKDCIRLLFWSGQSFEEDDLQAEGSFKAAEARYTSVKEVNTKNLKRWLKKSAKIQWDYKNLIKRKGRLERLK